MQQYESLMQTVRDMEQDFEKFYVKGQAAAGTRLRKGLSQLRKDAQEMRKGIQELKAQRKANN
ncbi:MAG: histone H1 [Ignavibacteriales bacterium CG12_big_fil_rev_8_21_14_0_65_30_8]|nr:MAG: histone H1 [Ignavibacteriales bacterium CG12_big_fil_rev_8_21_14_0_65_30_8]